MYIIILFISLIFFIVIIKRYYDRNDVFINDISIAVDDNFELKSRVMNISEQALYINLQKSLGEKFNIFPKIRIEDFIEVRKKDIAPNKRFGLRNKIKSRHIDFLICDIVSIKPILGIELDGKSHKMQVERDIFVDKLYKNVGLPIRRIAVGADFETEAIKIKDLCFQISNQ